MQRINLICLPFAGGNRYSYRPYEARTPAFINLIPIEYPGRGSRIGEPLLTDIDSLAEDACRQVRAIAEKGRYAFYGHSLGGLMTLLVARKLIAAGHAGPEHLFITGTAGPSAPVRGSKKTWLLGKEEFVQQLRELNGSPEQILNDAELLDFYEPILRADFQVSETYIYSPAEPVSIPITVITGLQEDITDEDALLWKKETTAVSSFNKMPGDHFFIFDHPGKIMDIIAHRIQTA